MKKAIIYLHGFNSASLDLAGNLLTNKEKLVVLQAYCEQKGVLFYAPNIDYRDFEGLVEDLLFQWNQYLDQAYDVIFMGSSMGGFTSEYLAMKTGAKAVMINPAIVPSELLPQFIGVTENYETKQAYQWVQSDCEQYLVYEKELVMSKQAIDRTIFLDMEDELIDSKNTLLAYQDKANIVCYDGGSHGFEHIKQALPIIDRVIFDFIKA
ncbi:MAG: hypothetical protein GQ582_06955 [Methyloprofundus sp.]|nr:hypothetical protein [Methyloprofundus sp.]